MLRTTDDLAQSDAASELPDTGVASGDASPDPVEELGNAFLNDLNRDFEDSVLLVGRVLGPDPEATEARVTSVDRAGVDIVTRGPAGERVARLEFPAPVADLDQLSGELIALVQRARDVSGEEGSTSAERQLQQIKTVRTFLAEVVAVRDLHPHLREVTIAGDNLRDFVPPGPDAFVYLLLPPPGRTELTVDGKFTWQRYRTMPEQDRPVGAYYTVRRWRPEVAEVDLDMVLHGDAGHASAWASGARAGDPVALWGPRSSFEPPPDTDWYLLVADETGLPAVAAILESLPEGTVARVFAEVGSESERQELPVAPSVHVTWLHRDGALAGTTSLLEDAVRAMPWTGGTPYAWGGAESRAMTAIRQHLREEVGLDSRAISLTTYWRRDPDGEV